MKHKLTILFMFFCTSLHISGQQVTEPSLKFGKPSVEELEMTVYEPDSEASAIVLYNIGQSSYRYDNTDFTLVTKHRVKIKVLNPEGKKYADISIPYYAPKQKSADRVEIYDIDARAFNLENGKRVKTNIQKEFIVRERLDDQYMQLKLSIPSVREGSIIEYQYTEATSHYLELDNWVMQSEIPVMYSEYNIQIPNLFVFNIQLTGKNQIQTEEKQGSMTVQYAVGSGIQAKQNLTIYTRNLTFKAHHLKALPNDEAYLWCSNDYKVNISFELQGVMQGENYKPYTKTWEDIDKYLLREESEYFGKQLLMTNPYHTEVMALNKVQFSPEERIAAMFHLLKKKLVWNGEYRLYSKNPEKVLKDGTGSNADLNFIFISMLREAGIEAWPAVLRQRNIGMLPIHYPSLQKLNTFIVAIRLNEDKNVYLDASMNDAYLNTLPQVLTVEKSRIISKRTNHEKWIDLTRIARNATKTDVTATLTRENKIIGTRVTGYTGQPAIRYLEGFQQEKDSIAFIRKQEADNNFKITQFSHEPINLSGTTLNETISFTKEAECPDGQHLYINPMIFTHINKNPFTQAERQMPIDMPQFEVYNLTTNLTLPENYEIEEIPLSQTFITEKKGIKCQYSIKCQGRKIELNYLFIVNQIHFNATEYPDLQAIWTATLEKNNALIVLKKL